MDLPEIDLSEIADERAKKAIVALLNLVQVSVTENQKLRAENLALRDELARLKGQPPRPSFPDGPSGAKGKPALSSEKERNERKRKRRARNFLRIAVDREEIAPVDRSTLPGDAEFKGYEDKLVQDLLIRTDNVLFRREKFYSPLLGKTFLGPLPPGCEDGFGPQLRAWMYVMYFATNTSQPRLQSLLHTAGVQISSGQISSLLTRDPAGIDQELGRAFHAVLAHCPYQHLDDTGTRVDGVGFYCHILSSPLGTFFSTRPSKSRQTVIEVLRNETIGHFRINEESLSWMESDRVPAAVIDALRPHSSETPLPEPQFAELMSRLAPSLGQDVERRVWDAAALADYHLQTQVPVVALLITDEAPQFEWIALAQELCWIHRGRNIKKLSPQVPLFQQEQAQVLEAFWGVYRKLRSWQEHPVPEEKEALRAAYDALAATTVAYEALAGQLATMVEQREKLLEVVLEHPEVPLHNNPAELPARERVRKRDVSLGPRTLAGAKAWDRWQSLFATLKTLGQNAYRFVLDRLRGRGEIPQLEELIKQRADELHLGWSWGLREPPSG